MILRSMGVRIVFHAWFAALIFFSASCRIARVDCAPADPGCNPLAAILLNIYDQDVSEPQCLSGQWSHETYLKSANNSNQDTFGAGVAISGDSLLVSAFAEDSTTNQVINGSDLSATDDAGSNNGAAYLFDSSAGPQAYFKAANSGATDQFGSTLAISGDTAVIGTTGEDSTTNTIIHGSDLSSTNDAGSLTGAVYVFTRENGAWSPQAYLKPSNLTDGDQFGSDAAIDGDTIVVGAPLEDSNTNSVINGSDLSSTNDGGSATGAAYVFTRSNGFWTQTAYLKAPNPTNNDQFGNTVAIAGDTIVVGSRLETSTTAAVINGSDLSATNDAGTQNGAAYVFVRENGNWSHQAYLKAPNNTDNDRFAQSIDVYGDTIVVGANKEGSDTNQIINGSDLSATNDNGTDNGAAYVFTRSGGVWSHQAYLKPPNMDNTGDHFGISVAVSGDFAIVGSWQEDSTTTNLIPGGDLSATDNLGTDNGAAYIFAREADRWSHIVYLKAPNNSSSDQFGVEVDIDWDQAIVGARSEASTTTSIIAGSDLSATNDAGTLNGAAYVFQCR